MANQSCGNKDGDSVNQRPSEQDMIEKAKTFLADLKNKGVISNCEIINGELWYMPVQPVTIIRLEDKQFKNGINTEDLLRML